MYIKRTQVYIEEYEETHLQILPKLRFDSIYILALGKKNNLHLKYCYLKTNTYE